jgi:hypothetical protein
VDILLSSPLSFSLGLVDNRSKGKSLAHDIQWAQLDLGVDASYILANDTESRASLVFLGVQLLRAARTLSYLVPPARPSVH